MHGLSIPGRPKTLQATFKISSFVAGIVFLFLSPLAFGESPGTTFDKMSLRQKVGQVFIWTFNGTVLDEPGQSFLEKYQPGALIVFRRNIQSAQQIAKLNSDSQKMAAQKFKAPLFLMVDQEGGPVTRFHTHVPLPSALALGRMDDNQFLQNFGKASGEVLRSLGFNVNLAPVLDISNPARDSFIGNRAFGENPESVAAQVVAYAKGLSESGILPTAKHFPGHGGVVQDSHLTTPRKLATYDELAKRDLVPFAQYAQTSFPKALMMAHLALPNIDPSGVPSTYSSILIQEDLRTKLNYDGLVFTDDLEMNGAAMEKDIGERAVRAFLAGNDMLMLAGSSSRQKRAFEAVYAAVKMGRISTARLKESLLRILTFKQQMNLGPVLYSPKITRAAILKLEDLSREVLKKNFQVAVNEKSAPWPELNGEGRVLVLSSDWRFFDSFKSAFQGSIRFLHLTPESLDRAQKEMARSDVQLAVFYASGAHTAHWLSQLPIEIRAKILVVNANHNAEVEGQTTFQAVLNINSHNPDCGKTLAEFLTSPDLRAPANKPIPDAPEN